MFTIDSGKYLPCNRIAVLVLIVGRWNIDYGKYLPRGRFWEVFGVDIDKCLPLTLIVVRVGCGVCCVWYGCGVCCVWLVTISNDWNSL